MNGTPVTTPAQWASRQAEIGSLLQSLVYGTFPTEAPAAILAAVVAGMAAAPAPQVIEDRRAAIAWAIQQAQPNDVVLIAGKGHEDYQEVAGVRLPFDDAVEARAALQARVEPGAAA